MIDFFIDALRDGKWGFSLSDHIPIGISGALRDGKWGFSLSDHMPGGRCCGLTIYCIILG
jgi:hypothetical protein